MKAKIVFTITLAICFLTVLACNSNNKIKQNNNNQIDSSLYITKDIKLNESLDTLYSKGIIALSINNGTKYTCTNKEYSSITFQEANINFSDTQSDSLMSISYATLLRFEDIQTIYDKLFKTILHKYQKPTRSRQFTHNNGGVSTNAVWKKDKMVIMLSSTLAETKTMGTVILIFTVPKDTVCFQTFMN